MVRFKAVALKNNGRPLTRTNSYSRKRRGRAARTQLLRGDSFSPHLGRRIMSTLKIFFSKVLPPSHLRGCIWVTYLTWRAGMGCVCVGGVRLPSETEEVRFDFKYKNLKSIGRLSRIQGSRDGEGGRHTKTQVDLRLVPSPPLQAPRSRDQHQSPRWGQRWGQSWRPPVHLPSLLSPASRRLQPSLPPHPRDL